MERLPCKKCGDGKGRVQIYAHFGEEHKTYRVTCPMCSYSTKEKSTLDEAEKAWNQRNA